jgi:outer membrane protein
MSRTAAALVALLLASAPVSAQSYPIDDGSILIGGSAAFTSQGFEDEDERTTTLSINPTFGYFITEGFAVGGEALIERISFDGDASTVLGIGPFLAYFFGGPGSRTYPFVQAGVAYRSTSVEGIDLSGFGADVSVGAAFMVARNAAITAEAFAQFASFSLEGSDESIGSNTYGLRAGVGVFIY